MALERSPRWRCEEWQGLRRNGWLRQRGDFCREWPGPGKEVGKKPTKTKRDHRSPKLASWSCEGWTLALQSPEVIHGAVPRPAEDDGYQHLKAIMPAITIPKQRSQEHSGPVKHLFYLKPRIYLFGSGPGTQLARTQTHPKLPLGLQKTARMGAVPPTGFRSAVRIILRYSRSHIKMYLK